MDKIGQLITEGNVPISIVESTAFKSLMHAADRRFKVPSRNYFRYTNIPEQYEAMRANIITDLRSVKKFSATMDGWTSAAGDPFLSLTIHYIISWELRCKCLATMYVPDDHTGANLASHVEELLESWGLKPADIQAFTTDSGSNMITACKKLGVPRLLCFGHVLHNAVTTAIKDQRVKDLITKCKKIVAVFSHGYKMQKRLSELQEEKNVPQHSLISDVSTRWGSKYQMLLRIQEQIEVLILLFNEGRFPLSLLGALSMYDLVGFPLRLRRLLTTVLLRFHRPEPETC